MTKTASTVRTLSWEDEALVLIDQRKLPHQLEYVRCDCLDDVIVAIQTMVIRGAPAIGIAAAYGVVLAARAAYKDHGGAWAKAIEIDCQRLRAARPTAVNLAWAVDAMQKKVSPTERNPVPVLLAYARLLEQQDVVANKAIGDFGALHVSPGSRVITHCNAGALATAGYGTALGVIRSASAENKLERVFATETRPWLQGARLTAWELQQDGIPVTLIADSAAAHLMRTGEIAWVITGADRDAANGDVANKIGTYSLAVCAKAHGVRFMVAAPLSTIDRKTAGGDAIPIECRAGSELLGNVAPVGVAAYNPVFDVTPAELVDVLVTERGAIAKPNALSIRQLFEA